MIQTEITPNPNALKFLADEKFSEVGVKEFQKKDIKDIKNDFVKSLLVLEGVELILVSENFISVKKTETVDWENLKPSIISTINDYFQKNKKPILTKNSENELKTSKNDNSIVIEIKKVLDEKVKPAVAKDGGDIKFISFNDGIVKVELRGSCSGCPSSMMTLKNGVQNLLSHYIPEVKSVEAI